MSQDFNAKELINIIKDITKKELKNNSENLEYSYFGIVDSLVGDRFNVKNPSDNSIYPALLNQTGTTISVGDSVIVRAKGDNLGNAYIAQKGGATINGGGGGSTYILPVATATTLGGIKSGQDITVNSGGSVTVNDYSHNHTISNVDSLQTALDGKQNNLGYTPLNSTLKGAANGLAELDSNGKVLSSQLPSYVGDVIEGTLATFPTTGEASKIYVDTVTNLTYRWSGTAYVAISSSLALGETSATAYRGDRGKIAYDHSQTAHNYEPAITAGTTAQFWSGGKTWRDLATDVRAVVLTGLSTATNATISATDTILSALGKIQKQITDHMADAVKHITATERTNWTTAYTNNHTHSNKTVLDATTASFLTADETKLDGISAGANNVETSTTNGNIKVDGVEKTVYTHPAGTNPHGTTKADVGLGNVDNTSDIDKPISTATQTALSNYIPLVVGSQTAATGSWTGVTNLAALVDGQTIRYWLPWNGSGNATLNLTLKDGSTTGAIACYYGGTTRLTTHYGAGNTILLTYCVNKPINGVNYTGWWADANFVDGNTYDRMYWGMNVKAGNIIYDYKIIMQGADGRYYPFTLEEGTGTTKTVNTVEYLMSSPILYYASTNNIAVDADINNLYSDFPITITYTFNSNVVAYKNVYLKGTITTNGNFKLDNTTKTSFITQTLPTTDDGFVYILLGYAYTTTAMRLFQYHPAYEFKDGKIRTYIPSHNHTTLTGVDLTNSTATTQATGDNTTKIATTAFVQQEMAASIDTIINKQGDEKYPKTVTSAIYDATTLERLDNVLATCEKNVSGLNLKMWVGTLDEYKAIAVKDASTLYFIKDIVEAV